MNTSLSFPCGRKIGLKPGRVNISHIEHEFCGARVATGHAVMTSVALERYFMNRWASLHFAVTHPGALRADYAAAGLRE